MNGVIIEAKRKYKHYNKFSLLYNPLCLYLHSPVAGFSLLEFEVS